jgi:predicted amidohydrolase YtcJ
VFTVPDEELRRTLPVLTVVGGRVVYDGGVL